MKTRNPNHGGGSEQALSLIELAGVMAILAILAAALVPVLIRQADRMARERERTELGTLSDGFKRMARRTRSIPSETGYLAAMTGELGWQNGRVLNNDRRLPRRFIIHPAMVIDPRLSNALPYVQAQRGAGPVAPTNVHFMIVSSVGEPLPAALTNGPASTPAAWSNLWNTADGQVPVDWVWNGQGRDLLIERVNLDDHFVELALNYDVPFTVSATLSNWGRFAIDGSATIENLHDSPPSPPHGFPFRSHYLLDTVVNLYGHGVSGALQSTEVLKYKTDFTYERDTWRASVFLGRAVRSPGPRELQDAMDLFMAAAWNVNAKGSPAATQLAVSNAMVLYMKAFINWRDATPAYPYSGALFKNVQDAQTELARVTTDLLFRPAK